MKNFEKYIDEITYALDMLDCNDCKDNGCNHCVILQFIKNFKIFREKDMKEWLLEEYKEPIQLSHDEYVILKNMNKRYKWMRRCNANNLIYVYPSKPKDNNFSEDGISLIIYSHLFSFISLNGELYSESYSIEQLIADYEKENENEV